MAGVSDKSVFRLIRLHDPVRQRRFKFSDAGARFRGNIAPLGPAFAALGGATGVARVIQQVHLVKDEQDLVRIKLLGNSLQLFPVIISGVGEQKDHIRLVRRRPGPPHALPFHGVGAAAPESGGVDDLEGDAVDQDLLFYGVPRCSRQGRDDGSFNLR